MLKQYPNVTSLKSLKHLFNNLKPLIEHKRFLYT